VFVGFMRVFAEAGADRRSASGIPRFRKKRQQRCNAQVGALESKLLRGS